MSKHYSLIFLLCLIVAGVNAQVTEQWVARYTSTGANIDAAADIVVDGSGNSYVTGTAWGTNGNFDYVTVKYDNTGSEDWSVAYNGGGNGYDEARAITIDGSGNVYVTGYSDAGGANYDYVTVKYNSSGVQQWATAYNGPGNAFDEGYDIAVDASGNVYVTGGSDGGGSSSDYATIMYNSSGVQQWVQRENGPGNGIDAALALILDGTNNVYVAGRSTGSGTDFDYSTVKYNSSGAFQWEGRYNGTGNLFDAASSITIDGAGNIYVTGFSYGVGTENDFATIKYDPSGNQLWAARYDGPGNDDDQGNAVIVDAAFNVYVTGRGFGTGSGVDYTTVKYDAGGNELWTAIYNGPAGNGFDEATDIELDGVGNIYVTGASKGVGSNNDYTTIKYDNTGNEQWRISYNGPANNSDQAMALAIDGLDNVYVTGKSNGTGTNTDYGTVKYCQMLADAGIDTSICDGDTTQFTASGGITYIWSPTTGLSNPNIANPDAFPATTTTYTVTVTNVNGCTDTDTIQVVVNPLPGPVIYTTGATEFCFGDSVSLYTDTTSGYWWNTGDTTISITVDTSGTYIVMVIDSMGCQNSTSQVVTAWALPLVSAGLNDTICKEESVNLTASGASVYIWTPGQTLDDSTIFNPVATPDSSTWYYVTGTDTNGCINNDTVRIHVHPNPPKPIIIYNNPDLISTPANTYQWYHNGVPINGETGQVHQPQYNGDYQVEITDSNGCTNISDIINMTGILVEEFGNESTISIYPNPNAGQFYLVVESPVGSSIGWDIINITGQTIESCHIDHVNGILKERIDIGSHSKGVYFLRVTTPDGTITRKIVFN